jgi:hypothetical protein
MSSLPESLLRFRTELEDAIRRELEAQATARSNGWGVRLLRAVKRRPGRTTLAVAALAAATGVALFASTPWRSSPGFLEPAQAARFLERTQVGLTPRPGRVLHFKVVQTSAFGPSCTVTQTFEYWVDQTPPYKYRAFVGTPPDLCKAGTSIEIGGEAALRKPTVVFRSPNTLSTMPRLPMPTDWTEGLRQAIDDGTAHYDGRTVLDGRTVERIRYACSHAAYPPCIPNYAYVDPESLQPVRVEWGGGRFYQDFVAYDYLSGTRHNRALADIRAQHPDARREQP